MDSFYRHLVAACLGLAGIFPLHASDPLPDPAECFLQNISAALDVDGTIPASEASVTALSGDGRTLLQFCRSSSDIFGSVSVFQRDFLFRDGVRTRLTDLHGSKFMNGPYTYSGSVWHFYSLPFDGLFALANTFDPVTFQGKTVLLSLPDKTETPIPRLTGSLLLSGNGAWAVGEFSELGTTAIRRIRLSDRTATTIVKPQVGGGLTVKSMSDNGEVVFGLGIPPTATAIRAWVWNARDGFAWLPVPDGFEAAEMDGNGTTFVGTYWRASHPEIPQVPAIWTAVGSLQPLPIKVPRIATTYGSAWKISGDGRLIFGLVSNDSSNGAHVVWTRDGDVFELKDLIRGVDFGGLTLQFPTAVSHDGKTIAGIAYGTDSQMRHYLARLALRGEGPKVSLGMDSAGKRTATFRAKNGFRYQTQIATALGQWTSVGAAIPGDNAPHTVELPDSAAATGFVRVVVEAQ